MVCRELRGVAWNLGCMYHPEGNPEVMRIHGIPPICSMPPGRSESQGSSFEVSIPKLHLAEGEKVWKNSSPIMLTMVSLNV